MAPPRATGSSSTCAAQGRARPAARLRRRVGGGARRGRRAGAHRGRLPHQPRVPVPLRDVRPVGQHARRSRCRAARSPRRSATRSRRCRRRGRSSCTTPAASSTRRRFPPRTTRRSPRPWPGFDRVIVEVASGVSARASRRRAACAFAISCAGRLEVAVGLETVHREALARAQQAHDARGRSPRPPRSCAPASRCGCSSCSIRRSCRITRPRNGRSARSDGRGRAAPPSAP